ncbi:MAG TPA: hypothetical protein PL066_02725 [bacterium]|nr:hypothetical protein [bacterium]
MINKKQKKNWREKILYYEVLPKGKLSGACQHVYKIFIATATIFALVLFIVYLSFFLYAKGFFYKGHANNLRARVAESWTLDENVWQGLVVDQDAEQGVVFLQMGGLNATLEVRYDQQTKIYCLEYQPGLMDRGRSVHASRVFVVPASIDKLKPGAVISLRELQDLDSGLYAPEILISTYDELTIPDLAID